MYLKKIKIQNFRNYGTKNNEVEFVSAAGIQNTNAVQQKELEQGNTQSFNVASATTLIVGKNNAGKTTIIKALDKLINKSGDNNFASSDFNFYYLNECMNTYIEQEEKKVEAEVPFIEFVFAIAFEDESTDRLTNLVPFMLLEDVKDSELEICVRYEIVEKGVFENEVKEILNKYKNESEQFKFRKFLGCIDRASFKLNFYDKNRDRIEEKFKLSGLFNLEIINANLVKKETVLSEAFNRIVTYRYEHMLGSQKDEIEESFDGMNKELTEKIENHHTKDINTALGNVVSQNYMKINLSADMTLEKVLDKLIRYEYVEKEYNIPEDQFGLGYTNLMMIIAALLDYIEHYPDTKYNSKINLVAIEEPETYMHPQMQELFINNINDVLWDLCKSKGKFINSQLIVTTHSSHILNSKIHSGNSFDNINYVYKKDNQSKVVILNNTCIMPDGVADENSTEFRFLKKHIKFKVSELFFTDGAIFVEGFGEETILPFYIERDKKLNKQYLSVFSINGAHGYLYKNLIKTLGVPTLIITDLDIEKEDKEEQVTDLTNRKTTNRTIKHFKGDADISTLKDHIEEDNIYLAYQGNIGGYYATSFEEAFILTNYDNTILNNVLKLLKKNVYDGIVNAGTKPDYNKNKDFSSKWQVKLAGEKGRFASDLLFSMIENENSSGLPEVPDYIVKGLEWLAKKLKEG